MTIVVNTAPTGPPVPTGGWSTVLADGFNNAFPLSGLWGPNLDDNGGVGRTANVPARNSNEVTAFNASQVSLDSGGLRLTAVYSPGAGGVGTNYLSGCCISQQFSSGEPGQQGFSGITGFRWLPTAGVTTCFEAVMAQPDTSLAGGGEDPSFWLSTPSWTDEIDIPELWNYGTKPWGYGITWIYNTGTGAMNQGTEFGTAAQTDQQFHRWTINFDGVAKTVRTYIDGTLHSAVNINWPASWSANPMYLILQHSLRNANGNNPTWTAGSTVFRYRSVAVYQDTPHAGTGVTGGLVAPGTSVGTPPPSVILSSDLQYRYGGGGSAKSALGGAISSAVINSGEPNNIWGDINQAEATAGKTTYACVFIVNNAGVGTWFTPTVWIDVYPGAVQQDDGSFAPGLIESVSLNTQATLPPKNAATVTISSDTTPPAGISFTAPNFPDTQDAGIVLPNLAPGQYQAIWLKRVIGAGASGDPEDYISIRVEGITT